MTSDTCLCTAEGVMYKFLARKQQKQNLESTIFLKYSTVLELSLYTKPTIDPADREQSSHTPPMLCEATTYPMQTRCNATYKKRHAIIETVPTSHRYERSSLSLLNEQEVHSSVGNDQEGPGNHSQANNVIPVRESVKAKGTENRCARHFDV